MNKIIRILLCVASFAPALAWGQMGPRWVNASQREALYPATVYITGFAEGNARNGETLENAKKRLMKEAQGLLSESVRVQVESKTSSRNVSTRVNQTEQISADFEANVKTASKAEIVGAKTENYFDKDENIIYAFAYVNKYELAGYYKANIGMLVKQAEGAFKTAEQLEQSGEKTKARKQCEEVLPTLAQVRYAQDLLTAIDAADSESLQQAQSEALRNEATQMMARLAQGLYVFVVGNENLFGKKENIIANKVKADLAHKGCSFVEAAEQADFTLRIAAEVRLSSSTGSVVFCYADVEVELFDTHKQKAVFNDEFSEKGGSSSQEKAGRKAMESAAGKVVEKLKNWISN
jgi:hypothetical protein